MIKLSKLELIDENDGLSQEDDLKRIWNIGLNHLALIDWFIDQLIDWLTDWLIGRIHLWSLQGVALCAVRRGTRINNKKLI